MKKGIHPRWYPKAKIICVCGHTFTVGSTRPEIHVEVCSYCHPFFTGEMRYIDTQGRVEKFMAKRMAAQRKISSSKASKKQKK